MQLGVFLEIYATHLSLPIRVQSVISLSFSYTVFFTSGVSLFQQAAMTGVLGDSSDQFFSFFGLVQYLSLLTYVGLLSFVLHFSI